MSTQAQTDKQTKTFWPYGVTIFLVIFVGIMVSLVIFLSSKRIDLVTKDYYSAELAYQQQIERLQLTQQSGGLTTRMDATAGHLQIQLPESQQGKAVTGVIHLYRPSNAKLDQRLPLTVDADSKQVVDVSDCIAGRWVAKIEWTCDGQEFYQEIDVMLR